MIPQHTKETSITWLHVLIINNSETTIHNLLIKRINLSSKVAQSTSYTYTWLQLQLRRAMCCWFCWLVGWLVRWIGGMECVILPEFSWLIGWAGWVWTYFNIPSWYMYLPDDHCEAMLPSIYVYLYITKSYSLTFKAEQSFSHIPSIEMSSILS